jgi:hypothetical protein
VDPWLRAISAFAGPATTDIKCARVRGRSDLDALPRRRYRNCVGSATSRTSSDRDAPHLRHQPRHRQLRHPSGPVVMAGAQVTSVPLTETWRRMRTTGACSGRSPAPPIAGWPGPPGGARMRPVGPQPRRVCAHIVRGQVERLDFAALPVPGREHDDWYRSLFRQMISRPSRSGSSRSRMMTSGWRVRLPPAGPSSCVWLR